MSKITTANKKAKAEGKIKGKKALTADAKKTKKTKNAAEPKEETKPSILNGDRCCHCKHYKKYVICGHYCDITNKPTPRKSTCKNHAFKS